MVNPVLKRGKEGKVRQLPLFPCRLDFLFILSIDIEHGAWNHLTTEGNSHDLALEKMRLLALEVRVREDCLIKITTKEILDLS